ncbi:RNA polymerase sigma factor [Mucilaginibacter sp. BT774]|uniref:RNA polymerase sigma factor n=1 Tax=Mucilaginibacter sp. BT774 TaxID=3062276 RepID=UPI002675E8B8|nr:sigma-70 family RNA polymerase sigma factor [Mucilaginibacter sp. BT774]MDO3628376.1 sigma-70 family RNA polymerase sigma factor [Mucilaginibacter sp. BT774]
MRLLNSYRDDELVTLLTQGDEAAFSEIYERYWLKLYNESHKRLKDKELCADIIQDVFADLWLNREDRKIENLAAYLCTAVRYRVFSLYKKEKNMGRFVEPIEFIVASASDPASIFFEKEIRGCIEIWLNMQPEKRKQVFIMKFGQDLSTREISEILHVSQKTVQNQFTTSLRLLRVHLGKIISLLL